MRQQIDTNLVGSIQVIRAALPHLRAQGGAAFCRCPRRAGRLPIRALACTTQRSGALRGLSRRYRRRWHRSTSSSPSSNRAPRPPTSAKAGSARPNCGLREHASRRDSQGVELRQVLRAWRRPEDGACDDRLRRSSLRAQTAHVGKRRIRKSSCSADNETRRAGKVRKRAHTQQISMKCAVRSDCAIPGTRGAGTAVQIQNVRYTENWRAAANGRKWPATASSSGPKAVSRFASALGRRNVGRKHVAQ